MAPEMNPSFKPGFPRYSCGQDREHRTRTPTRTRESPSHNQAAQIAGLPQATFLRELGKRRIPIHYGPQELAEDLKAIEELTTE